MVERRRVEFAGRVQGVGFRASTRSIAGSFPVTGWVRNDPDGSVTLEVQGEAGDIERMLARVRQDLGQFIRGEHSSNCGVIEGEQGFYVQR